ncbi:hypothetical protein BRYFOR_08868 [Marvinbryantia formatexigens DSM 14469]|uniref:Uncharacterized protein n=1 Tax=Marvinbryantia formatexigens DSM 14469 TaxID=478749 RepID=C6LJN1_9FIRM|nr:hypothetical protein [Marvinbryantia formatexigens]EET59154.1 hypothetical protein BRYFOR_08868 [Marvinbryantia formatexigens DSM 14469]UWO26232.1 hypothetical protein NQ534_07145 [Marvinbryantia formatexigens DSM 14469]SDG11611.1 hypothetical protein SAMN05660368_01961 [Marvinbryantia formatexigens]
MEDIQIVDLFFQRDEKAVEELSAKYHAYCTKIAWNLLGSRRSRYAKKMARQKDAWIFQRRGGYYEQKAF